MSWNSILLIINKVTRKLTQKLPKTTWKRKEDVAIIRQIVLTDRAFGSKLLKNCCHLQIILWLVLQVGQ